MALLQVVYSSRETGHMDPDELRHLCARSAQNNGILEITGVLVKHGSSFLQALEGPKVPVEDTFLRIIVDSRHTNLKVLSRRIITHREFGNWGMALFQDEMGDDDVFKESAALIATAPAFIRKAFDDIRGAGIRNGRAPCGVNDAVSDDRAGHP